MEPKHVLEMLDQITPDGYLSLGVDKSFFKTLSTMREVNNIRTRGSFRQQVIEMVMEQYFEEWGLFFLPYRKKSIVRKIDLTVHENDTHHYITFDIFAYLGIPKTDPLNQAAELKYFFSRCQELLLTTEVDSKNTKAKFYGNIIVGNERRRGKTSYDLYLKPRDQDGSVPQKLVDLAAESPSVDKLLTQVALHLNKVGPHSWTHIRMEHLTGNRWG